jgi:hypothetical protein
MDNSTLQLVLGCGSGAGAVLVLNSVTRLVNTLRGNLPAVTSQSAQCAIDHSKMENLLARMTDVNESVSRSLVKIETYLDIMMEGKK